ANGSGAGPSQQRPQAAGAEGPNPSAPAAPSASAKPGTGPPPLSAAGGAEVPPAVQALGIDARRWATLPPPTRQALLNAARRSALALSLVLITAFPSIARASDDEPVPPNVRGAVDRALVWLGDHQQPDGAWPHGDVAGTTAVPSLAVMAFLARGHVPGQG